MNQKIWILFKNDLWSSLHINHLFRSGKQNNVAKLTAIVVLLMGILLLVYNAITAQSLANLGEAALIPTYMLSVSSIMMIFLSLLRANGTIFGNSDFEQLSTYPISEKEIFISKLLHLYFFNLLISFLFTIPALLVWAPLAALSPIWIILFCMVSLITPVIPICVGVIFGGFVYRLAAYFQHMNLIAVLFSFILLGLFSYFVITHSNQSAQMQDMHTMLYSQITTIYLPSVLLQFHNSQHILPIFTFLFISCFLLVALIHIGSKYYRNLHLLLIALTSKTNAKQQSIKQRNVRFAIWQKEFSTLFSSYNYLLNSTLGIVVLIFFNTAILLFGMEKLTSALSLPFSIETIKNGYPMFIAAMLLLSNPSTAALSMEGNKIWILKTLPMKQKHVIQAKLACTFSLHFIGFFISILAFSIRLSPNVEQMIWAVIIPLSYSAFISTFGLMLNFSYPYFSWKNDMYIVKQSPPVLISAFTGMAMLLSPFVLILFDILPISVIYLANSIILIVLSIGCYQRTCSIKLV
ncbi:hypothetical protein [Oceanobacillus sp. J11TS1]|uniref:hypothetical protein n=1 Tax=Oceanobacillus sp. J11TS1 TaxID=2807191 RepID=UPI001BB3AF70|nr:hypothetical protein [Oceanobacillus sp. J11TS1]